MRTLLTITFLGLFIASRAQVRFTPAELAAIRDSAKAWEFSGSFLLVQNNATQLQFCMGTTEMPAGKLITPDTRFNIGSVGKVFTAILAMQAVDEGKLQLSHTIGRYLPGSPALPNAQKITVRQLLSHTSGLGDFFESPGLNEQAIRTTDDFYKIVCAMEPMSDTTGTRMQYSNSGFIVIGKILEGIYGKPYKELVQERILSKSETGQGQYPPIALGYYRDGTSWHLGEGNDPDHWSAAGGMFLDVGQLHGVVKALADGRLLPPGARAQMWQKVSRPQHEPEFVHYALGWMREEPSGLLLLGHNGGVRGYQAAFRYLPEEKMYLYILSNKDGGAEPLFMNVIMKLMEKKGGMPKQ